MKERMRMKREGKMGGIEVKRPMRNEDAEDFEQ